MMMVGSVSACVCICVCVCMYMRVCVRVCVYMCVCVPSADSLCSSSSLSVLCGRPIWSTWFWPSLLDLHSRARFEPGRQTTGKTHQAQLCTWVTMVTSSWDLIPSEET